jgi:hypothetical protein
MCGVQIFYPAGAYVYNNDQMLVAWLVGDDLLARDSVSYGIVFFNVCGVMAVVMVMLVKFYVP